MEVIRYDEKHRTLLGLRPDYTAYLFYLVSFTDMETQMVQGFNEGYRLTFMKKDGVEKLLGDLGVKHDEFTAFWNEAFHEAIFENEDGYVGVDRSYIGGKVGLNGWNEHNDALYKQFNIKVRHMCLETRLPIGETSERSRRNTFYALGYILCMMNYLNPYNLIVTEDFYEEDPTLVDQMSIDEFAEHVGVNIEDAENLMLDYQYILIRCGLPRVWNLFCGVMNMVNGASAFPVVNPYALGDVNDNQDKNQMILSMFHRADEDMEYPIKEVGVASPGKYVFWSEIFEEEDDRNN